jgi:hypothetical protein
MTSRVALAALAVLLALPPVRAVVNYLEPDVNRTTPAWKAREALIARAQVFSPDGPVPPTPGAAAVSHLTCQFVSKEISGTTAKFDCRAENGDVLKVKYGWSAERHAEVAATRLLRAVGFAADEVWMAARVTCLGCPPIPFETRRITEQFFLGSAYEALFAGSQQEFEWASVERKIDGRAVEVGNFKGWDWRELPLVKPSLGGATPAELDALRLIAVFLAHWDNKNTNQRLICADSRGEDDCDRPVLMMQDVGATFGPRKVIYDAWTALPVWKDAASCVVSMETLPYKGVLFEPVQISEAGRSLLAGRLRKLSEPQVQTLFDDAQFPGDRAAWVSTFKQKVREIVDRPPCPALSPSKGPSLP